MDAIYNLPYLEFSRSGLNSFGDAVVVRDPRGFSRIPSISETGGGLLSARGRFLIVQEYRVSRKSALLFLEVTRDPNPIHVKENIVPGALTLSKTLMLLEILFRDLAIESVKAKFTGAAFYGERTINHFFVSPGASDGSIAAAVNTYQGGRTIAKVEVEGSLCNADRHEAGAGDMSAAANLELIDGFCASLGIEHAGFADPAFRRNAFPRAFIASLPSGEMVRQLKGSGGMLNVLSLEFPSSPPPIFSGSVPEVKLVGGKTGPKRFSRILTHILDGIRTCGKGFALVHSPVS